MSDTPPEPMTSETAKLTLYRDAPDLDGTRAAAIGKFSCRSPVAGTALLRAALDRLADEGFAAVLGPMNGNTWQDYRLVTETDDRPAFLMEPPSRAHDLAAFEAAGFAPIARYFSAAMPLDPTTAPAPATALPQDVTVTHWDGADPEALFAEVHDLSLAAFAGNAFYKPIDRATFLAKYMPFVAMLVPELLLFARDGAGRLDGFLFGIPNYAEGRTPGSVILKTYASRRPGLGRAMAERFHYTARSMGFDTALHALIHDDNLSGQRSAQHGATIFRRYALMGRRLNG